MKLFISKLHYKKATGFLELIVLNFLLLCSVFYRIAVWIRNFLYDFKIIKPYRPKALVVSVGNITTGGVGKTPVVAELANYYTRKGKKTVILSRGYGGKLSVVTPNVISNGSEVLFDADMAGDEPFWLAQNCVNVPVVTCSSRVKAAKYCEDKFKPDVFILDDGFQHRKMERDLNLLLVDNSNRFGNEKILPAGPLRESLKNIKRADKIVLVNKSYDDEKAIAYCTELERRFNKKVYLCKMIPDEIYNIVTNEPLQKQEKIIAFCAIGQPREFYDFLKDDYNLAVTVDFEDHHSYDETNLKELMEIANKEEITDLVTTEKDAVKMKELLIKYKPNLNIYALKLKPYLDIEEICNG